ncbi:STAS domain-containing protein [Amycolatopsis eburnea]|uniref:Anti-sigma factor antagonist n=1 Tax=Amycolatopsis eburnea TaxID=2267691 RepID=A0A3R9FLE5_9PSEU|nr:STAS domain-containing protein [Amycolatopsis eburnea]RSD15397.1 anti-sigma factor antagonist [Amycolatopsis eburnea]
MSSDRHGPSAVRRQAAKEILAVERSEPRPGWLVVTAVGEIDAVSVRLLQRATWQETAAVTVVDLSGVTLLGAAGLRALAQAAWRARVEGGRLWLVVPPHPVSVALSMFWPGERVRGFATLAEALRADPGDPG